MMFFSFFFFSCSGDHLDLHVLTHSFPTRRSSDLLCLMCSQPPRDVEDSYLIDEIMKAIPLVDPEKWRSDLRVENQRCWESASLLRSEEHTSELQSLMRISYAVFCLKKKNKLLTYLRLML